MVPPKKFIHAWQTSSTITEVSRKTGLSNSAVSARGRLYKTKRGIPLKKLARSKVYDWDELRDYAVRLARDRVK